MVLKNDRDSSGRFKTGHKQAKGRPQGSRNRATEAALSLMDGQIERITQSVIDAAEKGDMTAARLILERLIPKPQGRRVRFELQGSEPVQAIKSLLEAVAKEELTPGEAAQVARIIESGIRAEELTTIKDDIEAIKKAVMR